MPTQSWPKPLPPSRASCALERDGAVRRPRPGRRAPIGIEQALTLVPYRGMVEDMNETKETQASCCKSGTCNCGDAACTQGPGCQCGHPKCTCNN